MCFECEQVRFFHRAKRIPEFLQGHPHTIMRDICRMSGLCRFKNRNESNVVRTP
jgi:hypothetical protein